jgi:hypothetical protein
MKRLISVVLVLAMAGCATCKSSDTVEQCRTKQRDKSQKNSSLVPVPALDGRLAAATTSPHAAKVGPEFN